MLPADRHATQQLQQHLASKALTTAARALNAQRDTPLQEPLNSTTLGYCTHADNNSKKNQQNKATYKLKYIYMSLCACVCVCV